MSSCKMKSVNQPTNGPDNVGRLICDRENYSINL